MSKYFFIIFSLIILQSCSTMMGTTANPELRSMENIIEFPNLNKDQIYIKSNTWFVETFNSAKSVIEFSDKESGKIIGNYNFVYSEGVYNYSVKQTIDLEIKDNKVKLKFSNPIYLITGGMGQTYNHTSYKPLLTEKGVSRARNEWLKMSSNYATFVNKDTSW